MGGASYGLGLAGADLDPLGFDFVPASIEVGESGKDKPLLFPGMPLVSMWCGGVPGAETDADAACATMTVENERLGDCKESCVWPSGADTPVFVFDLLGSGSRLDCLISVRSSAHDLLGSDMCWLH